MPTVYFRIVELVVLVPKVSTELNVTGMQTYLTHRQIFYKKTEVNERQV